MSQSVILVFVNLGREHAFLSVNDAEGAPLLVAVLGVGQTTRQFALGGSMWSLVSGTQTFQITAGDKNRIYVIGSNGAFEVDSVHGLTNESGVSSSYQDLPSWGGGGGYP